MFRLVCSIILLSLWICESPKESTLNLPSVITPVFPLPKIINSLALADKIILSEFTVNWSPYNLSADGKSLNAIFCFVIVGLNLVSTLPDVMYIDVPSLLISSSTKVPITFESNSGFCLFLK